MYSKLDNVNNNEVNKTIIEYNGKYMEFISYLCTNPNAFQRYNRLSSEDAADTFAKIKNKVE